MPQKIKRVGQWKVGDKVFQPDPRWLEAGITSGRTQSGAIIKHFSKDGKSAHLLTNFASMYWVPVEKLQPYDTEDDAWSASHWFNQAIQGRK